MVMQDWEGTSHILAVVSSEQERTCVGANEENFATWTGCLCASNVRRMALEFISKTYFTISIFFPFRKRKKSLACIKPVSSPATSSLPSARMEPLRATSLNLEMVFVTF